MILSYEDQTGSTMRWEMVLRVLPAVYVASDRENLICSYCHKVENFHDSQHNIKHWKKNEKYSSAH